MVTEPMKAEDFMKLRKEIRDYLERIIRPLIKTDFGKYIEICPDLYEIRRGLFLGDRERVMNNYLKLRKSIESNETSKK